MPFCELVPNRAWIVRRASFLLAAVLLSSSATGLASDLNAIVIGVDNYSNIRSLKNARNDAKLVGAAFRRLGYDVTEVMDPTEANLERSIVDYVARTRGSKMSAFYFAGHGVEQDGATRLLPADVSLASPAALEKSSMPLDNLIDRLTGASSFTMFFVDNCRNDPFEGGSAEGRGATRLGAPGFEEHPVTSLKVADIDRIVKREDELYEARPPSQRTKYAIQYATLPGRTASDGNDGNSPFAEALATALKSRETTILRVLDWISNQSSLKMHVTYHMTGVDNFQMDGTMPWRPK
jgi:uncharacterized caspase-like protein